jgi:hypothetical protein
MLDLETLSTRPDSVILTFGAIKFNPFLPDSEIENGIYIKPNVDEQISLQRHVDQGTLDWWSKQPAEIREEARISLDQFTNELNKFVVGANRIWAQGPTFDIVILENLYRQLGKPVPWPYYVVRDSRTLLKALNGDRSKNTMLHNALADCVSQARAIQDVVFKYELTEL